MSDDSKPPVRVRLYVETGFAGASHTDEIEIPRSDWDAMNLTERSNYLHQAAEEFAASSGVEWGWKIQNPADLARAVASS